MYLSCVLLYFRVHWVVISDCILCIKVATCVVDPFNYSLIIAIHINKLEFLFYNANYWTA